MSVIRSSYEGGRSITYADGSYCDIYECFNSDKVRVAGITNVPSDHYLPIVWTIYFGIDNVISEGRFDGDTSMEIAISCIHAVCDEIVKSKLSNHKAISKFILDQEQTLEAIEFVMES